MKAVEKAFYNLMFVVDYNEELKPISKVTKGKVRTMIENKIENCNNKLLHQMGYTNEDYNEEIERYTKMLNLLK
nr:MAG TPA: hypothetical protein [Caudoviricetes sp.]